MAECEEELKSLLMKVKEESEKFGLKLNISSRTLVLSVSVFCHPQESLHYKPRPLGSQDGCRGHIRHSRKEEGWARLSLCLPHRNENTFLEGPASLHSDLDDRGGV